MPDPSKVGRTPIFVTEPIAFAASDGFRRVNSLLRQHLLLRFQIQGGHHKFPALARARLYVSGKRKRAPEHALRILHAALSQGLANRAARCHLPINGQRLHALHFKSPLPASNPRATPRCLPAGVRSGNFLRPALCWRAWSPPGNAARILPDAPWITPG